MGEPRSWIRAAFLIAVLAGPGAAAEPQGAPGDAPADAKKVSDAIAKGIDFLRKNSAPVPLVEVYRVEGLMHGAPVDPGSGATECGATGPYFLDGICSGPVRLMRGAAL